MVEVIRDWRGLTDAQKGAAVAVGARPMLARVLVEHGALLARRGDRRAARARTAEGMKIAETLGMAGVVRDARAALSA